MAQSVLIVEDESDVVTATKNTLERAGYLVHTAYNGEEGVDVLHQDVPIDLIILDIQMPEMNGYTFMNQLKKMEHRKDTPVLLVTAYPELKPIFTLKGIKGSLTKPVRMEEFLARVKEALTD